MAPDHQSKKVIIAGGSGFLGLNLAKYLLEKKYQVVLISRHKPTQPGAWSHTIWDGRTVGDWVQHLDGAVALVNLAGRTVDCIKTPDHCDEILRSRVESTTILGEALRQVQNPPPVWVQMSTAHIYGDPPNVVCDENAAFGYGLAPFVGKAWEDAYQKAVLPNMRQVILRTSFILGKSGGALSRLTTLVRFGLGGKVSHGLQGMSWIHETDMNRIFYRGITDENMHGVYIATAPKPVSNEDFMRELRRALKMPIGLPAFAWMVKIGAPLVMKTDPELALYGRYCIPKRLMDEQFEFQFPDLTSALNELYRK